MQVTRDLTLYPLAAQLCGRRGQGRGHALGVDAVEHGAVGNAAVADAIESTAAHLAPLRSYGDIIAAPCLGVEAERPEQGRHLGRVGGKGGRSVGPRRRDIAHHHIAEVGIDTSAATLAAHNVDAVGAAIVGVDLSVEKLMAPYDHRWLYYPHEKVVVVGR